MSAVTSLWSQAPPDPFALAADLLDPPEHPTAQDAPLPEDFIEQHCTIEEPDGTVIPFQLWPFQRDVIRALHAGDPIIVLKARRLGLSWVVLAFALWLAIFQQGIRILVLCKNQDDAAELLDRIRRMRDRIALSPNSGHLLAALRRPAKERDAVTTLDVGSSTIRALVGTPAAARSETAGLVILDEFAFQRRASEIWRAVWPTIEGGGGLALVSTGNGPEQHPIGGEFARQWAAAVERSSPLRDFFFKWAERPDRDQAWKERTLAALGDPERFKTEYPEQPGDAFLSPDAELVYDRTHLAAATRLGAEMDAKLKAGTMPPPVGSRIVLGVDWGDFRTHAVVVWELERGGLYIPPGEVSTTRVDPETIAREILQAVGGYPFWCGEERYDASFAQSNRTFAVTAERLLGRHNPVMRTGRPDTVAVPFAQYKSLTVGYLRMLLRRTHAGEETRVLAISPTNTVLIEQLAMYEHKQMPGGDIKFAKGNDDAHDALLAGAAPVADRHRALIEQDHS